MKNKKMVNNILPRIVSSAVLVSLQPLRARKGTVEECILDDMALHIDCQFNKNSLLQCYFLRFLPAGLIARGYRRRSDL